MEKSLRPLGIQPPLHRRRLDFFRKSFHFSTEKSARLLGFEAASGFAEGVATTAAWYESRGLL
jgi:nucleoside-diphosphate-sugar epimerase